MKDINILLQDAKDVLDDLNIPYGQIVRCYVNTKALNRWGQCKCVGNNKYEIEISFRLLSDDVTWEAAMDTMIHELLHAYKNRMCHTGEWKRCAELVNKEYPIYNIKRCATAEERGVKSTRAITAKYRIICNECGTTSLYHRKTQLVSNLMKNGKTARYSCGRCKSHNFRVEVN